MGSGKTTITYLQEMMMTWFSDTLLQDKNIETPMIILCEYKEVRIIENALAIYRKHLDEDKNKPQFITPERIKNLQGHIYDTRHKYGGDINYRKLKEATALYSLVAEVARTTHYDEHLKELDMECGTLEDNRDYGDIL